MLFFCSVGRIRRVEQNGPDLFVHRPDTDEAYAADKAAIVKYAPQYADQVYAITVGSEALYRGNFTGAELLLKLQDTRKATGSKFKIGFADSWNKFQDGTADPLLKSGGADIVLCNAFSYWQGQTLKNSSASFFDDIMQAFGHVQSVAGSTTDGPELWVGETGMFFFQFTCISYSLRRKIWLIDMDESRLANRRL